MKKKLSVHFLSIGLVAVIFGVLFFLSRGYRTDYSIEPGNLIKPFIESAPVNFDDPADRAIFEESLRFFNPDNQSRNDSIVEAIENYRAKLLRSKKLKAEAESFKLDTEKFYSIISMYFQFILVFAVVLILAYYGTQTLALFRFIKMKQNKQSYLVEAALRSRELIKSKTDYSSYKSYLQILKPVGKALLKGFAYMILFSPAYVIAYSFKTKFDTDTVLFMIILGIISNGLLINYANKFYNFLLSESKKGYVFTGIVKNLNALFEYGSQSGIKPSSIFKIRKNFSGHILDHIFINAEYQYIQTIKEQASFVITGLIIIEMALNLQGHLSYEMLKNILFEQYDIVLLIVFMIFLLVKASEILIDFIFHKISMRYENKV